MKAWLCGLAFALLGAHATAAEFGTPGGPEPANVDAMMARLRQDPYDIELLVSFGTSKGGSAGHLALALRDAVPGDDLVYSANFYADRAPEHERDRYTGELMVRIPKKEYLYKTTSTLDAKASFGLDFGEVYKRSVVGIRVYGVPAEQKEALAKYYARMNDDYRARAPRAEYHEEEVKYGYVELNCAKTIGSGFRYGAGYDKLEVKSTAYILRRPIATALHSNIPTEMTMKLLREFDARGYRMDVVLYAKSPGSPYVDPHEEEKVAFKDLPNRFPSAISLDFRNEEGAYEDYDNLFAMYLLHNLGKYRVDVSPATRKLEISASKSPLDYPAARDLAEGNAEVDSKGFLSRLLFKPRGKRVGELVDVVPVQVQ